MWSYWIVDTQTGAKLIPVSPSAGSWRRVMNGVGQGTHTFQLRDQQSPLARTGWRDITFPWMRMLVACWNGTPVYAGIILRRTYNRDAGTLTVDHSELRTIFSRRHAFPIGGYGSGTLTVASKSARGAARAVVYAGADQGVPDSRWHLPVVLPADEAGGVFMEWYNYNFHTVEEMLQDVQNMNNGPDIDFRPRWGASGALEFEVRVGTPRLTGGPFEWNVSADKSGVADLTVTDDATKQLTGLFAIGAGSEADMRHGEAGDPGGSLVPFLDASRSYKSIDDVSLLGSYGAAELATHREATNQFDFSVLASGTPSVERLTPGATLRLWFSGDPWIGDGWQDLYLLGLSGDMSEKVKLEVQPL